MLSGTGLCKGLITSPVECYGMWCVAVCDLETSKMRRHGTRWAAAPQEYIYIYIYILPVPSLVSINIALYFGQVACIIFRCFMLNAGGCLLCWSQNCMEEANTISRMEVSVR